MLDVDARMNDWFLRSRLFGLVRAVWAIIRIALAINERTGR